MYPEPFLQKIKSNIKLKCAKKCNFNKLWAEYSIKQHCDYLQMISKLGVNGFISWIIFINLGYTLKQNKNKTKN